MAGQTIDPIFSSRTFELLELLHDDPRYSVYQDNKDEFQKNVEEPLKALMAAIVAVLPNEIRDSLETEKDLFSRFNKNDYGRGGAWDFYWGALYPTGGTRIAAPQLYLWINFERVEVGFAIGDYGTEMRERLQDQWRTYRTELQRLLEDSINEEGLSFGSRGKGRSPRPYPELSLIDWLDQLRELGPTVRRAIPRSKAVAMTKEQWVDFGKDTFTDLFPLFILSVSRKPINELELFIHGEKPEVNPPFSIEDCVKSTYLPEDLIREWVRAIHRKKQAVLYGPPGTGKTYVAEHLAQHLVENGDGFVELFQFHPAYAYEDFIQGIRPKTGPDGALTYPLVPGRFLDFCEKAKHRNDTCVLIIDEINRANLSRVFGELMYLMEYREREVPLAGGDSFSIPENVRIIGTMNTADRSIALVDHGLRRRFAFLNLRPDFEVLRRYHEDKTGLDVSGLVETLEQVNEQIGDDHYHVGISFFLSKSLKRDIADIWRMEIEPYLEEYFFAAREKVNMFRWDSVRDAVRIE